MAQQIHWFPGHMSKALKNIDDKLKMVDVVIELLDARAPFSSINEELEKRTVNKKKIIILAKPDLADETSTRIYIDLLKKKYDKVLAINLTDNNAFKAIGKAVLESGKEKQAKEMAKGMKPQPIRTMIIGIPNVGKSSLINRVAKRKAAGVENKPGLTRGEQWIKVDNNFLLLDTPGVLPMNYADRKKAINLALIGSIREDILPNEDLVNYLLDYLRVYYHHALSTRFNLGLDDDNMLIINKICEQRKLLNSSGDFDIARGHSLLLKEFKDGKLGRFSLENELCH